MAQFENLEVWRRSVALSVDIYRKTSNLKDFGFKDQISRGGLSIASNIAEGMERSSSADKLRFLDYALGSCGEVRTQAIIGTQVGFVSEESLEKWSKETKEIAAMISGLMRAIRGYRTSEEIDQYEEAETPTDTNSNVNCG